MISEIKKTILKENLIKENDNILIALSGGPDSVFLFHILRILKDTLSFNLYASHINHMYRGMDADSDERFVKELCEQYSIKLFIKRKNATEYARELRITEEEAGRKLRYDFFNENLNEIGQGKIAVAHNLNDQSETVLQRIIRGTGIDGLAAMSFQVGKIIRPILNIEKKDIITYLHNNSYDYCKDYTNELPIYGRNKIRLNLIPYLEENFNPNIQSTLFRMSRIMEKDSQIIEKYVNILFENSVKERLDDTLTLDADYIKSLDENEIGRVIRRAVKEIKGNTVNLENKHIDYAISLLNNKNTGKSIDLTDGITISISYNNMIVTKSVEKVDDFEYNINIGNKIFIKEIGKSVILNIEEAHNYIKKEHEFFVDYDRINGTIKVRNRRNSDFMIPFGMSGKKKLKDIFIDNKIPLNERPKLLVLEDDNKIIWLENYRISNECRVTANTQKILTINVVEDVNGK